MASYICLWHQYNAIMLWSLLQAKQQLHLSLSLIICKPLSCIHVSLSLTCGTVFVLSFHLHAQVWRFKHKYECAETVNIKNSSIFFSKRTSDSCAAPGLQRQDQQWISFTSKRALTRPTSELASAALTACVFQENLKASNCLQTIPISKSTKQKEKYINRVHCFL